MKTRLLALLGLALGLSAVFISQVSSQGLLAGKSNCKSYSKDLHGGRDFSFALNKGQTLTVQGSGTDYTIDRYLVGPNSTIEGHASSSYGQKYSIPATGKYYIHIKSDAPSNSFDFCIDS
ncbi:PPC domain-containing protein [Romeria aff. gracilis LEGE 07310]|uniref:PPC domain-containing protein n=1 Tax=Vasconcelosia minhoensis LEGE 07310 TaxID=915328 RepID=A0A8J7ASR0_9CYAN|nr:PPC domain-containing protein [Romeria gracilis]MBE9079680.1 PPC domain-containing protein [Romeria aff. gracilis LEGE 07310]